MQDICILYVTNTINSLFEILALIPQQMLWAPKPSDSHQKKEFGFLIPCLKQRPFEKSPSHLLP
jgi:hypothetical protein